MGTPIRPGDRIPEVQLATLTSTGLGSLSTGSLFRGKRVVLVGVPTAFSPTCTDSHLAGFQVRAAEILAKGVDLIVCVAVNDFFVMKAWAQARGIDEEILMLADGNGDLTRALGLELDLSAYGLGWRSQRYAAILEDGIVTTLRVEPDVAKVTVSGAEAIVAALEATPPAASRPIEQEESP